MGNIVSIQTKPNSPGEQILLPEVPLVESLINEKKEALRERMADSGIAGI